MELWYQNEICQIRILHTNSQRVNNVIKKYRYNKISCCSFGLHQCWMNWTAFFRSLILNTTCAVLRLTSLTSTANEKFTANIHIFHEIHTQILNLNAFTCANMQTCIQRYNGHAIVNEIIMLVLRAFFHSIISAAGYMLFLRFYIQPIHSSSQDFFFAQLDHLA